MAVFTDVTSFANHVASYGAKIEDIQPRAVKAAAEAARIVVEQQGSRFHIKGRRGGGVHLGAKVDGPYGYAGNWIAYVKPVPAGFWTIIEKGSYKKSGGYDIRPRRRGGKKALGPLAGFANPYVSPKGYFATVHHPGFGSIGHPWEAAVELAGKLAPKVYEREIVSVFGLAA